MKLHVSLKNQLRICKVGMIIGVYVVILSVVGILHANTYDIDTNKCTHMSSQLEGMFESWGISTKLVTGSDGYSRHMWIRLFDFYELDSVSLLPVVDTDFNQDMRVYNSFDEYENRYR